MQTNALTAERDHKSSPHFFRPVLKMALYGFPQSTPLLTCNDSIGCAEVDSSLYSVAPK